MEQENIHYMSFNKVLRKKSYRKKRDLLEMPKGHLRYHYRLRTYKTRISRLCRLEREIDQFSCHTVVYGSLELHQTWRFLHFFHFRI